MANYKPKKRSIRELVDDATKITTLLKQLNIELDKHTDQDLQNACSALTKVSPEFIKRLAISCIELSDLLTSGGSFAGTEYTLSTHLERLSTALSVEYDSKFIGAEL